MKGDGENPGAGGVPKTGPPKTLGPFTFDVSPNIDEGTGEPTGVELAPAILLNIEPPPAFDGPATGTGDEIVDCEADGDEIPDDTDQWKPPFQS